MKQVMTIERGTGKGRKAALAAAAAGLAGIIAASAGWIVPALAVWVAGTALAMWLLAAPEQRQAETVRDFLEQNPRGAPDASQIADQLRDILLKIGDHGESIRDVVRYLQEHATLVAWLISNFDQAASDAGKLLDEIRTSAGEVSGRGARVLEGSRKGLEFVGGIATNAEVLSRDAEALSDSSMNANKVVNQIQLAFGNVDQAVAKLSDASDQSTRFVAEVGGTMGAIRDSAKNSLELFENVENYARRGREVVDTVGKGVQEIRRSSESTMQRINELSTQSKQIEQVLGIINEVADETSLLALNAAILAAQAGERGAAFAVVADQIRSLAHRSRESIQHIENIVRWVQQNIREADQRMSVAMKAVAQGEKMGIEAVRQLDLIEKAVSASVEQARAIAEAVEGQDIKSAKMVEISTGVNADIHQIVDNLHQSSREIDHVGSLVQGVSSLSDSVRSAAEENHRSAREVAELMRSFVQQVEEIETILERQRGGVDTLDGAMASVADSAKSTSESLDTIYNIVSELVRHADSLRDEVESCGVNPETKKAGGTGALEDNWEGETA